MTRYTVQPAQKDEAGFDSLREEFATAGIEIEVASKVRRFISADLSGDQVTSFRANGHKVRESLQYDID
jgi:hypothetical protein